MKISGQRASDLDGGKDAKSERDGSDMWIESQCGGVRDWLWMVSGEVEVDQRNIEERWLDMTWSIFNLLKTWP